MTFEVCLDEILKIPEYLFGKASNAIFFSDWLLLRVF